jgi:pimeloyl-ACP methyl ester carboxylesterase
MLVIAAAEDRFIPSRVVERIAKRYRAPLRILRGHGHIVIVEPGWEELADAVMQWIDAEGR